MVLGVCGASGEDACTPGDGDRWVVGPEGNGPTSRAVGKPDRCNGNSLQSRLLLQLLCGSSSAPWKLPAPPGGVFPLSFLPSIRLGGTNFHIHPPSWETRACSVVSGPCCVYWSRSLRLWKEGHKYRRMGDLDGRGLFPPSPEAGCLRSRCGLGWLPLRTLTRACRWSCSSHVLTWPSLHMCLCPQLLFLWNHQSDWTRTHHAELSLA